MKSKISVLFLTLLLTGCSTLGINKKSGTSTSNNNANATLNNSTNTTANNKNSSTAALGAALGAMTTDDFGQNVMAALHNAIETRLAFLDAQTKLMQSLGLRTDAVVKSSEALRSKEGSSTNAGDQVKALKDSIAISEDADKQVAQAMNESTVLTAESRKLFAQGAVLFAKGILLETKQIMELKKLADSGKSLTSGMNPIKIFKALSYVKPTLNLAALLPGNLKECISTMGKLVSFAKSQHIEDIPDADKAASNIGNL
jgi:hypothetical protein